jgi:hypothetical protein
MSATILPRPATSREGGARIPPGVPIVLGIWFTLVLALGSAGAFVARAGTPPIAIGIGVAAPLLVFFSWLRLSASFRHFVLTLDLRLIAALQAWRWAGLGFLFLYAYKILPPVFALTAGLGDMAVGFAAPWMVLGLARHAGFAGSAAFVRWNVLGIVDLVVAITLGTLSTALARGATGEISTAPMGVLPLLVIPAFLVPLFLMLHASALMQSRRIASARA